MSIHDLIAPHRPLPRQSQDDDIQALVERARLADFPYRNLTQQSHVRDSLARWPLLAELALARGQGI